MLGRGIVADPGLALAILADQRDQGDPGTHSARPGWRELQPLLLYFWQLNRAHIDARARAGRMKQWLNFLRRVYPEAEQAFAALRTVSDARVMEAWLIEHLGESTRVPAQAGLNPVDAATSARS
jgi:tRNA-dihydrouridine synthase C